MAWYEYEPSPCHSAWNMCRPCCCHLAPALMKVGQTLTLFSSFSILWPQSCLCLPLLSVSVTSRHGKVRPSQSCLPLPFSSTCRSSTAPAPDSLPLLASAEPTQAMLVPVALPLLFLPHCGRTPCRLPSVACPVWPHPQPLLRAASCGTCGRSHAGSSRS